MALQNHKLFFFILIFIGLILSLLKLCTGVVTYEDDPTSFFVIKKLPSLASHVVLTGGQSLDDFTIILVDENGLIGEDIYYFLVTHFIWIYFIMSTFFCAKKLINK